MGGDDPRAGDWEITPAIALRMTRVRLKDRARGLDRVVPRPGERLMMERNPKDRDRPDDCGDRAESDHALCLCRDQTIVGRLHRRCALLEDRGLRLPRTVARRAGGHTARACTAD